MHLLEENQSLIHFNVIHLAQGKVKIKIKKAAKIIF
jgi:hypothetical protein